MREMYNLKICCHIKSAVTVATYKNDNTMALYL